MEIFVLVMNILEHILSASYNCKEIILFINYFFFINIGKFLLVEKFFFGGYRGERGEKKK